MLMNKKYENWGLGIGEIKEISKKNLLSFF